jgi:inner membrane protein
VDNVCHTLTGAALADAGLKHRTRFGSAALIIAANLPDVDVLAFVTDTPAVALRRGWTHGVVAQLLLPVLLTGVFVLLDKWRPAAGASARRVRPSSLLLLCYVGVVVHVAMDWLNNYGVRLLMPFSDRWFYGDVLFIVDPWLWLTLAAGCVVARRRRDLRPARLALIVATAYVLAMTLSAIVARQHVVRAWTAANGRPPAALMVGPVPIDPFRKSVIVDAGGHYETGTFRWWPTRLAWNPDRVPRNDRHPAALRASSERDFRALLVWSRFPFYEIARRVGATHVTLGDMRFADRGLFEVEATVPDQ